MVAGDARLSHLGLHPAAGPGDIFDAQPIAAGEFPDLTANHELLVVGARSLLIWQATRP